MPKIKTHSGAKKRFKLTATGKVKFKHANMRHILSKKTPEIKRTHRKGGILAEQDAKHIRVLLGVSS